MKLLIVEDDPTIGILLSRVAKSIDLESKVITSGEKALAFYQENFFPIIISDIGLPGMDGLELCAKIRQLPTGSQTVIMIVTGHTDHGALTSVLDAGADDFMTKPLDIQQLSNRLKILLNRYKSRQLRVKVESALYEANTVLEKRVEERTFELMQKNDQLMGEILERVQADAKLKKLTHELELRVEQRTEELTQINGQLHQEIAERARAENQLRLTGARLNNAQYIASIGSFEINQKINETYWSDQLYHLLGYEPGEVQPDNALFWQHIHPDDYTFFEKDFQEAISSKSFSNIEFRICQKSGAMVYCHYQAFYHFGPENQISSIQGTLMDVTERKVAERALKNRLRYEETVAECSRKLLAGAPNAIDQTLLELLRVTEVSRVFIFENFLDAGKELGARLTYEVCQNSVQPILPDPRFQRLLYGTYDAAWADSLNRGNPIKILVNDDRSGIQTLLKPYNTLSVLLIPIHVRGEWSGFIGFDDILHARIWNKEDVRLLHTTAEMIGSNITRRKTEVELRLAKEQAEAASKAKSEFLSHMSHELRTPLNGILGYAQILKRDRSLEPQVRAGLSIIERSGNHLLNLINEILDLSKIEAQKMELYPSDFFFVEFLNNLVQIVSIRGEKKGLKVSFEMLSDLPQAIRADEKRLGQVLLNLLSNAIKFTDKGRVILRVQAAAANIGASPELKRLRFEVEDTGKGIPGDKLADIFSAFKQVAEHTRAVEGTGLGLTISQRFIQLMGGEIYVESTQNRGSRFWFELLLPEVAQASVKKEKEDNDVIGYLGPRRKILIVDDRSDNRNVLANLLRPLGFEIVEAVNGLEAIQKTAEDRPDIVLMDLVMPVMDGFEATRRMREDPTLQDVKIVAISASSSLSPQEVIDECGCDEFLAKPVQFWELLAVLKSFLNLEWQYETLQPVMTVKSAPSSSQLSVTDRDALRKLAILGKRDKLLVYLAELEAGHSIDPTIAGQIRPCAENLQFDKIKILLENLTG